MRDGCLCLYIFWVDGGNFLLTNTPAIAVTAVKHSPKNLFTRGNLVIALKDVRSLHEAAEHSLVAIEIDPKNAQVRHNYGLVLQEMGKSGREQWELALELDPDIYHSQVRVERADSRRRCLWLILLSVLSLPPTPLPFLTRRMPPSSQRASLVAVFDWPRRGKSRQPHRSRPSLQGRFRNSAESRSSRRGRIPEASNRDGLHSSDLRVGIAHRASEEHVPRQLERHARGGCWRGEHHIRPPDFDWKWGVGLLHNIPGKGRRGGETAFGESVLEGERQTWSARGKARSQYLTPCSSRRASSLSLPLLCFRTRYPPAAKRCTWGSTAPSSSGTRWGC